MLDEVERHGDRVSAGTPDPILHGPERKGLVSSQTILERGVRHTYLLYAGGPQIKLAGDEVRRRTMSRRATLIEAARQIVRQMRNATDTLGGMQNLASGD